MTDNSEPATSELPSAEVLRRRFARGWGAMGVAWGVPPATALVHGYLLAHGGPLTGGELERALGLSDRAVRLALVDCEGWGIVERAPELRRSGARGPAAVAWQPVADHWEWFRRVVTARKHREADPVIGVIDECLAAADRAGAGDPETAAVGARLRSLVTFVHRFEVAVSVVERADARSLEHLFAVLARVQPPDLDRVIAAFGRLPADELARFVTTLAGMSPATLRRLLRVASDPRLARVLALRREDVPRDG